MSTRACTLGLPCLRHQNSGKGSIMRLWTRYVSLLAFSIGLAFGNGMSAASAAAVAVATSSVGGLDARVPLARLHVIRLTGRLEDGDSARLAAILTKLKATTA